MALGALELEILREIPTEGVQRTYAYAVWRDRRRDGELQMGPVRMRRELRDGGMEYECSPFPGGWDWHVSETDIVRVRHVDALSITPEHG